ncbi:helix-turn-helix transcriptional regulator [Sphaerisporangium sp. NPDC051011]|uniref:helix-turn-helix domain-containing protein n=1 Tax=Sphaerisporangium sp. NPDC051011 TaxID=3155792 RepID=UPI0033CCD033
MATTSPTIKRRQLSATLRQLREESGMTAAEAARRLTWAPSKITRIERNEWKLPNLRDIRLLLDLYGVTDEHQCDSLLTLAKESRKRGWWADYKDVFRSNLAAFEAGASMIRTYEVVLIPGLLQTAAYAAAVWRAGQVVDESIIERHVQARLARQAILERTNPPSLAAVVDEAALLRIIGSPEVMRHQVRRLIEMAARPNITIQVLPNAVGAHAALNGAFMILDFPRPGSDPSLVYMATSTDSLWLETPEEHRRYTLLFSQVQALALSPYESLLNLTERVEQYGK